VDTSERIVVKRAPRKRRSVAEKRRIVEETLEPDASVARVARAHGVNANQVFAWRRRYRQGLLDEGNAEAVKLLPVQVTGTTLRKTNRQVRRQAAPSVCGGSRHDSCGTFEGTTAHHGACGCGSIAHGAGAVAGMIGLAAGTRIWIVAGVTDMRRGFVGLSGMVQTALAENPFSGQVFVFRGKRGDLVKLLWWDGDGLCLFAKRLESGRFIWPQAANGTVSLTPAQLSMLLEGIDWRRPVRSCAPQMAV
jgi:transposase